MLVEASFARIAFPIPRQEQDGSEPHVGHVECDVHHAVAVGYPDALMGERVAAFVESATPFDLEACRRWFSDRGVAKFKTPEQVERLDHLPLLGSGKPARAALQRRAAAT